MARTARSHPFAIRRRRTACGFTLIEVLVIAAMLALALFGAIWFRKHVGGPFAGLIGGAVGCFALPALGYVGWLIAILLYEGYPRLPNCRNGCCRGRQYDIKRVGDEFYWVCQCGDRYKRRSRHLVYFPETGEPVIVRTWRPFRGWFPKRSPIAAPRQPEPPS